MAAAASLNTTLGGALNSTITSVAVVASFFPARTKNGTPDHRQESTSRLMAP